MQTAEKSGDFKVIEQATYACALKQVVMTCGCNSCMLLVNLIPNSTWNWEMAEVLLIMIHIYYYPFKKYVEYTFFPGCQSMMSRYVLRL